MVLTNMDWPIRMKEPLIWFFIIGIVLFVADRFSGPAPIIVDDRLRNQIATLWETQMGLPPSENELESLIQNWVKEEIFYRESVRLGLDNEDTIIRRRLVQKLTFLTQDFQEEAITRQDLEDHYNNNLDKYTLPIRYSLSQIYFSELSMTEDLQNSLKEGLPWRDLGNSSLLPRSLVNKSLREITSTFGTEFVQQINSLHEDQWVGPISSTFGLHLVRLDAIAQSEAPPLSYIEKQVATDLLHERRESSLNDYYEKLLTQYDVEYR